MRAAAIAKLRQKQKPTANSEGGTKCALANLILNAGKGQGQLVEWSLAVAC